MLYERHRIAEHAIRRYGSRRSTRPPTRDRRPRLPYRDPGRPVVPVPPSSNAPRSPRSRRGIPASGAASRSRSTGSTRSIGARSRGSVRIPADPCRGWSRCRGPTRGDVSPSASMPAAGATDPFRAPPAGPPRNRRHPAPEEHARGRHRPIEETGDPFRLREDRASPDDASTVDLDHRGPGGVREGEAAKRLDQVGCHEGRPTRRRGTPRQTPALGSGSRTPPACSRECGRIRSWRGRRRLISRNAIMRSHRQRTGRAPGRTPRPRACSSPPAGRPRGPTRTRSTRGRSGRRSSGRGRGTRRSRRSA